jgi:hypothetical protein
MTKATALARITSIAGALLLAGCAASAPAQEPPTAARRSNVAPPSIAMSTRELQVAPGSRVMLTARTGGGEAMLFTVDWKVVEGDAGGRVEPGRRNSDGSYEAAYTAPAVGGTYHVTATIREFPSATATTVVRVTAR